MPGRKSAAETPGFLAFPPSAALYYQTLPHTLPVPSPANFQEVEKIFIRNYVAMMSDEISIAEGVKRADQRIERILQTTRRAAGQVVRPIPGRRSLDGPASMSTRRRTRPHPGRGHPCKCRRRLRKRDRIWRARRRAPPICSSLPSLALYALFVLVPVVVTFILSFSYYDPMAGSRWVGLDNFIALLHRRPFAADLLEYPAIHSVRGDGQRHASGLLLALALNRAMPGYLLYLFRLAYFLPVIIAAAFVSIVWGYFYGDDLGVINYYLIRLGFSPVHWLTSSSTAMMSIVIMDVWKNAGFFMIIFIAALQGVPKTLMEAAVMDGASYWRRFFRIVLPWISPVVFFAIVYASIGALQVFELIVILTRGGPGDATRSMSIYIVEEAFDSFEIGYAASVAVVMTLGDPRRSPVDAAHGLALLGALLTMQTQAAQRWIDRAIIAVMAALGVVMLLPFAWLFSMSFRARRRRLPHAAELPAAQSRLQELCAPCSIRRCPFLQIYANSVEIAVIVTIGQLRHLHAGRVRLRAPRISRAATACSSSC